MYEMSTYRQVLNLIFLIFFFPKKKLYGDYFYNSRIYFYVHVCVTDLYNFIILVT